MSEAVVEIKTKHLEGWLLGKIESGSSRENNFIRKNICFMYLNKRPIDPLQKVQSALNDIYRKYNKHTKYIYILNLVLPWESYDVNLAPNKREILIKEQLVEKIVVELKEFIEKNIVSVISEITDSQK